MAFVAGLECIYAGAAKLYNEAMPGATPNYVFLVLRPHKARR